MQQSGNIPSDVNTPQFQPHFNQFAALQDGAQHSPAPSSVSGISSAQDSSHYATNQQFAQNQQQQFAAHQAAVQQPIHQQQQHVQHQTVHQQHVVQQSNTMHGAQGGAGHSIAGGGGHSIGTGTTVIPIHQGGTLQNGTAGGMMQGHGGSMHSQVRHEINGLVQDCSNSSALAMELLQSCTKPLEYHLWNLNNSLHHKSASTLDQVILCRMFGTNALPESVQRYCQLGPQQQISVKVKSK